MVIKVDSLALQERLGAKAPQSPLGPGLQVCGHPGHHQGGCHRVQCRAHRRGRPHGSDGARGGGRSHRQQGHPANEDEMAKKDVRCGDTVLIQRAGDVIPEVVKVNEEERPKGAESAKMPERCPACETPLVRPRAKR